MDARGRRSDGPGIRSLGVEPVLGDRPGDDLRLDLSIDFREAVFGVEKEIQLCNLDLLDFA